MHEHISPLLGEHPRIVNIFLGPVTVHYREVSRYIYTHHNDNACGRKVRPGKSFDVSPF